MKYVTWQIFTLRDTDLGTKGSILDLYFVNLQRFICNQFRFDIATQFTPKAILIGIFYFVRNVTNIFLN